MRLTGAVERPDPELREVRGPEDVVGIDVGLTACAVRSDGTRIAAPKPLEQAVRRVQRRAKQRSRKQQQTGGARDPEPGEERTRTVCSRTSEQAVVRVARVHRRIRTMRQDVRHTVTTALATATPGLVVEDWTVRGLARHGSRSRAMLDGGWVAFRRMLEDTCAWDGVVLRMALRDVPSTKRCSGCGWVGPALPRSRRVVPGAACGVEVDRDRTAACTLGTYGRTHRTGPPGSAPGRDASGDPSGGGTAREGRSPSDGSMQQDAARHEFHLSGGRTVKYMTMRGRTGGDA